MQATYKAAALNLVQYATNPPREGDMPVLQSTDEIDYFLKDGWVVIGHATVTVDYLTKEEIQSQQLGALKAKLQTVRADNQQKENAILDQISKLQAIGYTEAA